jgi:cytochrome bd-type quinol oxidase subunit 2
VDYSPLTIIGVCALAVLIAGWLFVSFTAPGRTRTVVEWLAASAMYGVLLTLFVHLVRNAIEADNTFALVAFGFLCALFAGGLLVSLYHTVASSRGGGDSGTSATN